MAVQLEDLILGIPLAVIAVISLLIALHSRRGQDREAMTMTAGFGAGIGLCALVLCTGWVDLLALSR